VPAQVPVPPATRVVDPFFIVIAAGAANCGVWNEAIYADILPELVVFDAYVTLAAGMPPGVPRLLAFVPRSVDDAPYCAQVVPPVP